MATDTGNWFSGEDRFGSFVAEPSRCKVCGKDGLCIGYSTFEARGHDDLGAIDPKHLIIGNAVFTGKVLGAEIELHGPIGVTCGCYGRLHRQVAHIQTEQKYRDSR